MTKKRAKHQFHCEKCQNECMIYKKGKNHRVLVCPHCGVLATNGKLSELSKRSNVLLRNPKTKSAFVEGFAGFKNPFSSDTPQKTQQPHYVDRFTAEERVELALR